MKCEVCGKKIEEIFLSKLKGTIIKINKQGKNKICYACSGCQKKYQDKLKGKIKEKA